MFSFLAPYKLLIQIGLVLAVIGGLLYGVSTRLEYERSLGYQEAASECTTKKLLDEIDARDKKAAHDKQVQEAQNAATLRGQEIKKLSDSLAATNRRLRDTTTAISNSLPTISCDAARKTADAALAVFSDCAKRYTTMGENADGHASDVKTLTDSCMR